MGVFTIVKIIVHGALGRVGSVAAALADSSPETSLAAAVDVLSRGGGVYPSLDLVEEDADVIVDFSHHTLTPQLLGFAVRRNIAVVLGTTGHDERELGLIRAASESVPIFFSANMSLGVALLARFTGDAARTFPEADAEIVELHHKNKLDAPSGTALMLAHRIEDARGGGRVKAGRTGSARRRPREIGVHSLRMGSAAGTHTVIFSTQGETITLTHEARDVEVFARGALRAAAFVVSVPAGLYGMEDMANYVEGQRGGAST